MPILSLSNLSESLKNNLPMDHYKKINPELLKDIINGKHSLAGNPSLPSDILEDDEFLVKIFAKRFESLYNEGKRVMKKDDIKTIDVIKSSTTLVELLNNIEKEHKFDLEELAKKIVTDEFDVDPQFVKLNVKLINNFPNFDHVRKNPTSNVKLEIDSKEDVLRIKNEVHKRRFVNALMQGISNRFNHIYHMYRDDFNKLDRRLVDGYQKMMTSAELAYFMMDTKTKKSGGFCSVQVPKNENEPFIVNVEAMSFPLLVHETIKGVLEVISLQGLPEDENEVKYIFERADFYEAESWDMILGVGIWDAIVDQMSLEAFSMKQHIFYELVILPVDEFHETMQEILTGSKKGKLIIERMVKKIKNDLAEDEKLESLYRLEDYDDYTNIQDIPFDDI